MVWGCSGFSMMRLCSWLSSCLVPSTVGITNSVSTNQKRPMNPPWTLMAQPGLRSTWGKFHFVLWAFEVLALLSEDSSCPTKFLRSLVLVAPSSLLCSLKTNHNLLTPGSQHLTCLTSWLLNIDSLLNTTLTTRKRKRYSWSLLGKSCGQSPDT